MEDPLGRGIAFFSRHEARVAPPSSANRLLKLYARRRLPGLRHRVSEWRLLRNVTRSWSRCGGTGSSRRGTAARGCGSRRRRRRRGRGRGAHLLHVILLRRSRFEARSRGNISRISTSATSPSRALHRATDEHLRLSARSRQGASRPSRRLEPWLQQGRPPQKIFHNCSGKHAGMLALCRAHGWDTQGYRLPDHPVQQACRAAHAEAADVDAS